MRLTDDELAFVINALNTATITVKDALFVGGIMKKLNNELKKRVEKQS